MPNFHALRSFDRELSVGYLLLNNTGAFATVFRVEISTDVQEKMCPGSHSPAGKIARERKVLIPTSKFPHHFQDVPVNIPATDESAVPWVSLTVSTKTFVLYKRNLRWTSFLANTPAAAAVVWAWKP